MPVKIHESVGYRAKRAIQAAAEAFERETCIRISKYRPSRHQNYVHIIANYEGCFSLVGQVGGPQILNLEPGDHCDSTRTVIHEFMHALGVFHEHQRYDRDNHIKVLQENIMPDALSQYEKESAAEMTTLGEAYDYGSIMHYGVYAGSKNRRSPAFRVLGNFNAASIGRGESFSRVDIRKLNRLYQCDETPSGGNDDDDDEPITPRPFTPRPTAPPPIDNGASGCTNDGCCCKCDCIGLICDCNCNCNCDCTCMHYSVSQKTHCSCNCPNSFSVPGKFNYQITPKSE